MASEIQFEFSHGRQCYALVRNGQNNQIWNTSGGTGAFEVWTDGNYAVYPISCSEDGSSAHYAGNFPPAIPPGDYAVSAKQQLGGSPAETDPTVATGDIQWNGITVAPLSDTATSGQIGTYLPMRLTRGVQILNFPFKLVQAGDHVTALTSGICSGQISRDGGAFGILQSGQYTEIGKGWYSVQALTSGDLLANTAIVSFQAVSISGIASDPREYPMILQRTSGAY